MSRGGSASRSPEARRAAAVKGWQARKRRAVARLAIPAAELEALRGSQADRAMRPGEAKTIIDQALANMKAREAGQ